MTVQTGVHDPALGLRAGAPLEGDLVRLVPLAEQHREELRRAAEREPEIHRYTVLPLLGFDRWFDEALEPADEAPFVVEIGGRLVGSTRLMAIEPDHRRAEIGWTWYQRAHWGTGANTEAKYLLLREAFERCGLMRVQLKTDMRNARARAAILGIGAQLEGVFRKHMILADAVRDSAWYAIVDDDWPRVKGQLEAKLAARRAVRQRPA
jgi:RimJ/RimL family protein N-acetyltransferase